LVVAEGATHTSRNTRSVRKRIHHQHQGTTQSTSRWGRNRGRVAGADHTHYSNQYYEQPTEVEVEPEEEKASEQLLLKKCKRGPHTHSTTAATTATTDTGVLGVG